MSTLQEDYNTQRKHLNISEYGRHIQEYVQQIQTLPSKEERTKWATELVQIMSVLNPEVKLQNNYREILWGHLFQIADYSLDVDCPYPIPTREEREKKPESIGYSDTVIKFRFYGRNLQNMVDMASDMDDEEMRKHLVNLIASFMYNSCKSWNNENLSNETIAEHMKILSKGKLDIQGEQLVVSADNSAPRKFFKKNNNNNNRNLGNKKFNRNKGGFRRF